MGSATSAMCRRPPSIATAIGHLIDAAAAANAGVVLMSIVGASADASDRALSDEARGRGIPSRERRAVDDRARNRLCRDSGSICSTRQHAASGRPVIFGRGANPINFVSVSDVAALVERAVVDPSTRGATFEIGGPQNVSFNELAAESATRLAAKRNRRGMSLA